jgi:pilus assembly protein FimV
MKLFQQPVTLIPFARWVCRARPTVVALATLLALPDAGHALGLGRTLGEPVLGESLQLEVPIIGTLDRPLDNDCVTIRRPPDSIDADYFPRDLIARVDRQGNAPRLLLTTRSALRQPLVEFRVSITCGYNLSHDYLLMASPRNERAQPVATAPVVGSPAPATVSSITTPVAGRTLLASETPVIATPTIQNTAAAPSDAPLPDGIGGKTVALDRDMTLEQLARLHFPGPLRQERFMRWVAEANPRVFTGVTKLRQHRLRSGQQMVIPDGVPPRRPSDYKNGVSPLGEPMAAAAAEPSATPTPGKSKPVAKTTAETQPGKTANDGRQDRLVVGSGSGTAKDIKETVALVDRLTGMMQQQLSTQTASDEKIQKLESALTELGQYVAKLESEARQREVAVRTELQAIQKSRADETERGWWQLLLAVIAGGLAGVGMLKGYGLLTARRRGTDPVLDNFSVPGPRAAAGIGLEPKPAPALGRNEEPAGKTHRDAPATPVAAISPPRKETRLASAAPPLSALVEPSHPTSASETASTSATPQRTIDFEPPGVSKSEPAWHPAPETVARTLAQEPSDPATAAIELANIMTSMGLAESAAQTLVEHIRANPRQSLRHWLKLLELHRLNGNRAEFERSANEMREHFNVQADEWTHGIGVSGRGSLETYPHIHAQIVKLWRTPDCLPFLQSLLADNREGTRVGFPLPVAEEILLLIAILSSGE